mgnify:CR=1 FL=1
MVLPLRRRRDGFPRGAPAFYQVLRSVGTHDMMRVMPKIRSSTRAAAKDATHERIVGVENDNGLILVSTTKRTLVFGSRLSGWEEFE